ncbi:MAG: EamA family transporter [Candidatus Omnitrophica bacterium]|nr:EamA family transporter [Candidatus Omnitrophota bacterium]
MRSGIIAGIIAAVSWGTVFVFGQIGVREGACHPIMISLIRFLSASFFLLAASLLSGIKIRIKKRDVPTFLLLGISGIFGMNILVFSSLKYTAATSTSILMNSNPIIITLLAGFILKEKSSRREILAILIGFLGCYLTISQGRFSGISYGGNLLALGASFCWALYTIIAKKTGVIARYGAVIATFWPAVFGSILLFFTLLLLKIPFATTKTGWLVGIYLGLIPAGLGFTLWFFAVQRLKVVAAGVLQFLAPLTTGIIAVWWLKERISGYTIFGGILILAGAMLPFVKNHAISRDPKRVALRIQK